MTVSFRTLLAVETRKLARAATARVAALASAAIVVATTVGGSAAATMSPDTEIGRKAASMLVAPGWDGYAGLAALSVGVAMLLAAGIVMAWSAGREFAEGTVVGLFAIPPTRGAIACAKVTAAALWIAVVAAFEAIIVALGGIALGLPPGGGLACAGELLVVGATLGFAALPVMWVATRWRGYLPGIGATLAIVIVTNLGAGFGLGTWLPWAVPVLWASPGAGTSGALLVEPLAVGAVGAGATVVAWARLELGRR